MDPKKSNRVLGFPALITGLCQFYGVPVTPSKVIRPPTIRAFIKKYCAPMQAEGETPQQPGDGQQQATNAPPPPPEPLSSSIKRLEWAQTHYDQLNLIEGKRLMAMSHGRLYPQRIKNAFDKKVRPHKFN